MNMSLPTSQPLNSNLMALAVPEVRDPLLQKLGQNESQHAAIVSGVILSHETAIAQIASSTFHLITSFPVYSLFNK
jgi:hypothetical protein